MADGVIGLLQTPQNRYSLEDVKVWAMDNGCFTESYPGDDAYLALLDKYSEHRERCLFVAAPDKVGDAAETLRRFEPVAERIREAGYPVALVGQDGMENLDVPWRLVDWLFVGGSTDWKLGEGARALISQAKEQGKRVHVGRVNSRKRYNLFRELGCDSADGTFIAFGPAVNTPKVLSWVQEEQLCLKWRHWRATVPYTGAP